MEVAAAQRGGWTGPQQRRVLFHAATASKTSPLPGSSSILPQPLNASTNLPAAAAAAAAVPSSKTSSSSSAHEAWFWSAAAQKIGAGLSNLGNTCFLNSVLQCLTYTPPLAGYLKSGQHQATCRAAGFCALCALQAHVKQALASSGNVVSPSHLVKNLRSISKSFRNCRQEDAHEYMRYLIEAMHNCCIPVGVATNSSAVRDRSLVYSIFGGQLRSQVKCTVCSHCSNTYDPFLDLSLEIVRADSLTKALARFTAVESLDGNNKYYCSHCKKKVPALKQFTVDKAPNVLTIQFKRFSGTGSSGGKLDKKIEFGRTLDMQPFISNPQEKNAKYTLYAVLVHAGWSTHSGHYYCYVRTASGMWHALDDSRVKQVSERVVMDQKAYILFYIRDVATKTMKRNESAPLGSSPSTCKQLLSDGATKSEDGKDIAMEEANDLGCKSSIRKDEATGEQATRDTVKHTSVAQVVATVKSCAPNRAAVDTQMASTSERIDSRHLSKNVAGQINGETEACKVSVHKKFLTEATVELGTEVLNDGKETRNMLENDNNRLAESIKDGNQVGDCSTSGKVEDAKEDDCKRKCGLPTHYSYVMLLRVMPHTRHFFPKALGLQRHKKQHLGREFGELDSSSLFFRRKNPKRLWSDGEQFVSKKPKLVEDGAVLSGNLVTGMAHPSNLNLQVPSCVEQREGPVVKEETCSMTSFPNISEVTGTKCTSQTGNGELHQASTDLHKGHEGEGGNTMSTCMERVARDASCRMSQNKDHLTMDGRGGVTGSSILHTSSVYDAKVPQWDDTGANGHLISRKVDSLVRRDKIVTPQIDPWDEEYDRGKVKKVRNKPLVDQLLSSGLQAEGANPFQAFCSAKQHTSALMQLN